MKRADIIKGVSNLNSILTQSKLLESFKKLRDFNGNNSNAGFNFEDLLISLNNYSIQYNNLGEIEKSIIRIMGLQGLEDPKIWAQLLYNNDKKQELAFLTRNMENTLIMLPKIADLISPETDQKTSTKNTNKDVINLVLPEDPGAHSSPERLSKALESISLFYSTCAALQGFVIDDLSVISLDSGKDKSIDFIGTTSVIKAVKDIIISIWHNALYYSEKPFFERTELIKQSLPIIGKIEDKKIKHELGGEQAEIHKRNITMAAEKFISAGALILELEQEGNKDPRKLLSPEPKLLINNEQKEQSDFVSSNQVNSTVQTSQDEQKPELTSIPENDDETDPSQIQGKLDSLSNADQELFMELFEKIKTTKKTEEDEKPQENKPELDLDLNLNLDSLSTDTKSDSENNDNLLDPKDSIGNLWNFKMNHKLNDMD